MDGSHFLPSGGGKEDLKDLISQPIILSSFLLSLEIRNRALQLGRNVWGESYRKCFQKREGRVE